MRVNERLTIVFPPGLVTWTSCTLFAFIAWTHCVQGPSVDSQQHTPSEHRRWRGAAYGSQVSKISMCQRVEFITSQSNRHHLVRVASMDRKIATVGRRTCGRISHSRRVGEVCHRRRSGSRASLQEVEYPMVSSAVYPRP